MKTIPRTAGQFLASLVLVACALHALAQPPGGQRGPASREVLPKLQVVEKFDKDGDGRLNSAERHAAMAYLDANPQLRRPGRRPPGPPETPKPAVKLASADVKTYPDTAPLFDAGTLRTLFVEFEDTDWERQMVAFHRTDVLVPAKLTVDGKVYRDVGVHFRGENSFFMVRDGWKRSMTLVFDFAHKEQNLTSYHGLHLMNAHEDPSFLRTVLYMHLARQYFPAPKANFLRVVINGECWGVYVNQQRFDKDFIRDNFQLTQGARFKSPGRSGNGAFTYLGDDVAAYKRFYELRSKEDPKSWTDLARFCKVLDQTPPDQLVKALEPILDIDSALAWFALDNVSCNDDSYWHDANDFAFYQDQKGRYHLVPHDVNEAFGPVRVRGSDTVRVDPFAGATDKTRPLLMKLLAVPELRAKYLGYMKDMAENWLDWKRLGPVIEKYRALIAADIERDTHKLYSTAEFTTGTFGSGDGSAADAKTLKGFAEQRRAFLLDHPEIKKIK